MSISSASEPQAWLRAFFQADNPLWPTADGFYSELVDVAGKHRIRPLLLSELLAKANSLNLPRAVAARASADIRRATAAEMVWQEELISVCSALAAKNIAFLIFKGSALAYTLYPQPWMRSRGDTDLLFPDSDSAAAAWQVLLRMGYQRLSTVGGELLTCQYPCSRELLPGITHMLDVHWGTSNHRELRVFTFAEIDAQAVPVSALGPYARMPGLEHALVLACLHRLAHSEDGEENRLIWLYDIHLLMQTLDDAQWQSFADCAKCKGQQAACYDGLERGRVAFGATPDIYTLPPWDEAVDRDVVHAMLHPSLLQRDLANLRKEPGNRQRLQLLAEHLFPTKSYMQEKYNPRWSWLLPYYYIKRMVAGFLRRLWLHLKHERRG